MEKNENGHDRGLHLVIMNPLNGKVEVAKVFDTYATSDQLDTLIENGIPEGRIVIAGCKDDCYTKMSGDAKSWFQKMGSKEIYRLYYRDGFAFIGVNGKEEAIERKAMQTKHKVSVSRMF